MNKAVYKVPPTAPGRKARYTDISLTNLFMASVNMINVEKQLIWNRYTAFLVGNTIVFNLLSKDISDRFIKVGACIFGVILCLMWYLITYIGWLNLTSRINRTRAFIWNKYINPLEFGTTPGISSGKRSDIIRNIAFCVIVLFAFVYLAVLLLELRFFAPSQITLMAIVAMAAIIAIIGFTGFMIRSAFLSILLNEYSENIHEAIKVLKQWHFETRKEAEHSGIENPEGYFIKKYSRLLNHKIKRKELFSVLRQHEQLPLYFRKVKLYRQTLLVDEKHLDEAIGLDSYEFLVKVVWPLADLHARATVGKLDKSDLTTFEYFNNIVKHVAMDERGV